ncbi:metal/formaldehyde-sensitive transcriptional repressor [Litorimonas sp.]|uniref:metal/formaldehyde-sensitive transcriptional repressor n=1 Tax=Litorimonas sp. TaxID=1892381 RepID=UPI003A83A985
MSHTSKNQSVLLARVRRIKGQIEAVERGIVSESPCADILNLVASVRGAVNGLTVEMIEDHIRTHVANPETDEDADRAKGAEDLIRVIRTYLK